MPIFQAITSHIDPKETQGLLERINNFVKENNAHFTIALAAGGCEVRCVHPAGLVSVVADSMAAPSDMTFEVLARMEVQLAALNDAQNLAAIEESAKIIPKETLQ